MSQTETLMLVALGFVVAALVALFLGRLFWSYSVGLGARRMQRAAPETLASLQADRDRLRAENAMLSRKLELRLNDLKSRLAEQAAEVSRNRNRINNLMASVRERDATIELRETEIAELKQQLDPLEDELAARTHSSQQLKETVREYENTVQGMTEERARLAAELARRDRQISTLQAQVDRIPDEPEFATSDEAAADDRLLKRISELTALSGQIEAQRAQIAQEYDAFHALQDEITSTNASKPAKPRKRQVKTPPKSRQKPARAVTKKPRQTSASANPLKSTETISAEDLANGNRRLEQQIDEAERETHELQSQLKELDAAWTEKLADLKRSTSSGAVEDRVNGTSKNGSSSDAGESSHKDPDPDDHEPVAVEAADATKHSPKASRKSRGVVNLAARIRALQKSAVPD